MDHIGERMAIQNSKKIGCETQPACDLSQTSEEDRGADQPRVGGEVFGVTRIANESMWRNAVQQKRRTPETRGADHDVGLRGESLEVRRELPFNSFGFELRCDPAQPLDVAGVEQHALHDRRQTTSAAGTYISRGANDEQSCVSQVTLFERAHLFDALHDESNGQRIAGREHGIVFFRKLVEIAFDQNGAESAEAHDFGSGLDRAGRGRSDASEVLVHIGGFQTVGRNETVDVQAARVSSSPRFDVDMADRSRRDPGKDVLDLVVGERCKFPSAQDSEDVRRRSPTLLMADQREIDLDRRLSPS